MLLVLCSWLLAADHPELVGIRANAPIVVDGVLSEPDWAMASQTTGFKQIEPENGAAARLDTTARVLFDDDAIYISAVLHDDQGVDALRVPHLKRDFDEFDHDYFGVVFDTLNDGRNATAFLVDPWGTMRDLQVFDDDNFDVDWDALWRAATTRSDDGWIVEIAIPWKTLRYQRQTTQFGLNFVRSIRRLNEIDGWSPWVRPFSAYRMSYAGTLSGLAPPPPALNLLLRPYATLGASLDHVNDPLRPNAGGDLRWAPTPNVVVDLTGNTDFAEADVDRQVVNLSRFSVFYPERRQFFLESASLFTNGLSGSFQPFFSRRIGLTADGRRVPLNGGARVVWRTEDRSAGAIVVHSRDVGEQGSTLFAIGRYNQHLGEQSRVGALLTFRHDFARGDQPASTNVVPVLDGLWRYDTFSLGATLASSWSSHKLDVKKSLPIGAVLQAYNEATWGTIGAEGLLLGPDFDPQVGFVSRPNMLAVRPYYDLDLRPDWKPSWLRRFNPALSVITIFGADDQRFQEANVHSDWGVRFESNDELYIFTDHAWQNLTTPFEPIPGLVFEPGKYDYGDAGLYFQTDQSRKWSGSGYAGAGHYFRFGTQFAGAKVRFAPLPHISVLVNYEFNHFGLGATHQYTHLIVGEGRFALTPKIQLIGVAQYNSASEVTIVNARFAWEFRPLSFLFVVYDRRPAPIPSLGTDQRLVMKVSVSWLL